MQTINKTMTVWAKHAQDLNIARPTNRAEYERLLKLIERITDTVEDLEHHPYTALLDLALNYAHDWEEAHDPMPESSQPGDALEFWMDQHGTSQKDLERAGVADQPTISKILKGERAISKAVAKRLGAYFGVSPLEFL